MDTIRTIRCPKCGTRYEYRTDLGLAVAKAMHLMITCERIMVEKSTKEAQARKDFNGLFGNRAAVR